MSTNDKKLGLILIIAVILITALINIYKPFLTTQPTVEIAKKAAAIVAEQEYHQIVKQVRQEFADITEASLIKAGVNTGSLGFNTDTQELVASPITINSTACDGQKPVKVSDSRNTRLVINEGFDATIPLITESHELRLFYRPDCTYSTAFMPIWLELSKSLPSNVTPREINCGVLDANGVSTCANWLEYGGGITSVPAIQLVSNIAGIKRILNFSGSRSYQQIKAWLADKGITLKYNPNAEHFQDANPLGYSLATKEGFSDDSLFNAGTAHGDHGKMADDYDKAYLDEAQEDNYGHIRDVDKNGIYKATFSTCQPDPQGPEGYQVFTRRGQWGCVVPDANSGINTPFDAAFTAVDSYLSMLPPITDPSTGKLTGVQRTPEQRINMKREMAAKHAKDIRAFGLCDEPRLKQKYNTYELVKSGKAKLPDGVALQDYLDTQESASAIYSACSM